MAEQDTDSLLISEMGNTFKQLSKHSNGPHLTEAGIFQSILEDLGLQHIHMEANEPYAALIDSTRW